MENASRWRVLSMEFCETSVKVGQWKTNARHLVALNLATKLVAHFLLRGEKLMSVSLDPGWCVQQSLPAGRVSERPTEINSRRLLPSL